MLRLEVRTVELNSSSKNRSNQEYVIKSNTKELKTKYNTNCEAGGLCLQPSQLHKNYLEKWDDQSISYPAITIVF